MTMDTDDLEPIKKIKTIDFDDLSIQELEEHISILQSEIKRCKDYISTKQVDKLKAEELFKK
jgi:uncharacterized small protein (DUF1192 family)|tara:strand:+ start:355 stop:540 length:186 start_codon:yes stop_codon:yes gene_type:complete